MMAFIKETSKNLADLFEKDIDGEVELHDIFGRFSMDTIASCAFSISADSLKTSQKDSDFVINAKNMFRKSFRDVLKVWCNHIFFKFHT